MDRRRALAPFENGALARRLFGDFDRFFEETAMPWFRRPGRFNEFVWVPELEIAEHEGRLTIHVDLPGLKKEEVTVTATEEFLTIEGERKRAVEEKTKNGWIHTERTYGRFSRTVALPEGVKPSDIVATFENGVLEVTVPLPAVAAAVEPQNIPIGGRAEKKAVQAAA
jgi:HSP20 family protein